MVLMSIPASKPAVIAPIISDNTTDTRIRLKAITKTTATITEFIRSNLNKYCFISNERMPV